MTVGADDLTANYRVEQHVEVVEERERDGKLLRLLSTCHKTRCESADELVKGSVVNPFAPRRHTLGPICPPQEINY